MLYSPYPAGGVRPFLDNFSSSITDSTIGTSITPGAANVKGSTTGIFTSANISRDCFGISIVIANGATAATVRRYLIDIMIDPAGGTAWTVLIPNLLANSPSMLLGGCNYYFPLRIPAGSAIGARCQSNVGTAIRVGIQLFSNPKANYNGKWGTYVEDIGATTASTSGTAITPSAALTSLYTSIGTTTKELWWWQWGGIATNDTTLTVLSYIGDVALGNASFKETALSRGFVVQNTSEQCGKDVFGLGSCVFTAPPGTTVYIRAACSGAPDSTTTTMAYGMG